MRILDMKLNEMEGAVKAFFKVETQDGFVIDGFKVVSGKSGLFVSAPSRKIGEKFVETVTMPREAKNALSKSALEEFHKLAPAQGAAGEGMPKKDDAPF